MKSNFSKRITLLIVFVLTIISGKNVVAQTNTMNCDSLLKEFDTQIAALKKEGASKEVISQLQTTKAQFVDMFCKSNTKPSLNTNELPQLNSKNSKYLPTSSFTSNYEVTIQIKVENTEVQSGTVSYLLAKDGKSILLNNASFASNPEMLAAFHQQETNDVLDAWVIQNKGASAYYVTSKENGKIMITHTLPQNNNWQLESNQPTIKANATGAKKQIAGYTCSEYKVIATTKEGVYTMLCWVSDTDMPFVHPEGTLFGVFSAQMLSIPNSGSRMVLAIKVNTKTDAYEYTVKNILPKSTTISLSGYKPFDFKLN
jgi:hypothetical protein